MKVIKLGIGELYVSQEPCLLVCHGLGSCIGLFLFDRTRKIGGGAHIQLPFNGDPRVKDDGRHAEFALLSLLKKMKALGSEEGYVTAKMTGGANINQMGHSSIGEKNTKKVRALLREQKIYLSRSDTGGNAYRKATFNTSNCQLTISQQYVELIL